MKAQTLVLSSCSTNEYDPAPYIVVTVDAFFRRAVRSGIRLCKRHRLAEVAHYVYLRAYETLPDEMSDVTEEARLDTAEAEAVLQDHSERTGIRGEKLVVTSQGWHLECYCKYNDTVFTTRQTSWKEIELIDHVRIDDHAQSSAAPE